MPKRLPPLSQSDVDQLLAKGEPGRFGMGGTPPGVMLRIIGPKSASYFYRVKIGDNRRDIGLGNAFETTVDIARLEAAEFKKNPARTPTQYGKLIAASIDRKATFVAGLTEPELDDLNEAAGVAVPSWYDQQQREAFNQGFAKGAEWYKSQQMAGFD